MRSRLGKASDLVMDDRFLPMFRNRQINFQKEFEFSVRLALAKRSPERYFAAIWKRSRLKRTVDWLRKMMNQAKHAAAVCRQQAIASRQLRRRPNKDGLERLLALKRKHRLVT